MRFCLLLAALTCSSTLSAQTSPPALNTLPPESVIATVNGKDVTAADLRKMISTQPPVFAENLRMDPRSALQSYFVMRELYSEGEKKKVDQREPLKSQIEAGRAYLIATEMVNEERNRFQVSNEAMEQFYMQNQARYSQASVKVIGIRFLPAAIGGTSQEAVKQEALRAILKSQYPNLRTEDEAMKRADEVIGKLKKGADFAKMVDEYSDDQDTKAMGGDFGWVKGTSSYPEAFKKAALAIETVGGLSQPTKVEGMLYILRLEEKKVQPLDEVREPIIQELRTAHFDAWFKGLMNKYQVTPKNVGFFMRPGAAAPSPAKPQAPSKP